MAPTPAWWRHQDLISTILNAIYGEPRPCTEELFSLSYRRFYTQSPYSGMKKNHVLIAYLNTYLAMLYCNNLLE